MINNVLDTINLSQLGQRLQMFRKKQGLTQADAASVIGVARTTITAIEKGERRVKASELIKLAEAYGRQISDFVQNKPQIELTQVQFRSQSSINQADEVIINKAIDELLELCTNYFDIERAINRPLAKLYPPVYRAEGLPTEKAAEGLAISERNRLGLGESPIYLLRDTLERLVGLRIFYLPLKPSSKISEVYFYETNLGGCIGINILQSSSKGRCRWSLAHAYAHFLAHRTKTTVSLLEQRKPESEYFADYFANYFLMPTNSLMQRFNELYQSQGKITPSDLLFLANYYGVSFQAIVLRLENLELIPSGILEKLYERGFKVNEAEDELGINPIPENTEKFPERYKELALQAYNLGEISEGELAIYLQTDILEARTFIADHEWQLNVYQLNQDLRELVTK
ncbi:MAG: ImmA/IrrE family metallo-endopeptidase [Anaerolineales bacterium]|nr:ImmA/IrrE family metallo-endopeptidase [Anaerolineales bacterium]